MKVFVAGGSPKTEALLIDSAYLTADQIDQLETVEIVYQSTT